MPGRRIFLVEEYSIVCFVVVLFVTAAFCYEVIAPLSVLGCFYVLFGLMPLSRGGNGRHGFVVEFLTVGTFF